MVLIAAPYQGYVWPRGAWQKISPGKAGSFSLTSYVRLKATLVARNLTPDTRFFSRGVIGSYSWQPFALLTPIDMSTDASLDVAAEHVLFEPAAAAAADLVLADCQKELDAALPNHRCWHDWYDWQMTAIPRLLHQNDACYWNSIRIDVNHLQGPHRDSQLAFGIPSLAKIMGAKEVTFRLYRSDISELSPGTSFEEVQLKPGDVMIFDSSYWHEFRYPAVGAQTHSDGPPTGRYLASHMTVLLTACTPNQMMPMTLAVQANPRTRKKDAKGHPPKTNRPAIQAVKKSKAPGVRVETNIEKNSSGTFTVFRMCNGKQSQITVSTLAEARVKRDGGW